MIGSVPVRPLSLMSRGTSASRKKSRASRLTFIKSIGSEVVVATIDKVVHHATIIKVDGESYRAALLNIKI